MTSHFTTCSIAPSNGQYALAPLPPLAAGGPTYVFRVQGSGFRVQGSGFRVQGSGFRVQGSGFRVQGSGFRVQGDFAGHYI